MKNAILKISMLLMVMLPIAVLSQQSAVDQLFDKYSEKEGFTTVSVTKGLFELFAEIDSDDPDFDDFQKAVEGLESLRLIAYSTERGGSEAKVNFHKEIMSSIPFNEFKELMVIKDKEANVNFYAKNDGKIVSEMIMVVDGEDEAVLLSMTGNINLDYVAKMGKAMNMSGMNHLGKMKKSDD